MIFPDVNGGIAGREDVKMGRTRRLEKETINQTGLLQEEVFFLRQPLSSWINRYKIEGIPAFYVGRDGV